MEKRRCQFEGCRAWARRGSAWCVVHPEGHVRQRRSAPMDDQKAPPHDLFATYVPVVALEEALKLPPGDLRMEIAAVRAAISAVLRAELAPADLLHVLDKGTGALARMLRINRQLGGAEADEFQAALDQVLAELGLGDT